MLRAIGTSKAHGAEPFAQYHLIEDTSLTFGGGGRAFTAPGNSLPMTHDTCSGTSRFFVFVFLFCARLPFIFETHRCGHGTARADRKPSSRCSPLSGSRAISDTAITAGIYSRRSRDTAGSRAADTRRLSTSTRCR